VLFYFIRTARIKLYLKTLSFTEVSCERINECHKGGMISVDVSETSVITEKAYKSASFITVTQSRLSYKTGFRFVTSFCSV